MFKVFIDGQEGTTGLKIVSRLQARKDIQLLSIDAGDRKNVEAKLKIMESADITFLCLPDQAAKEIGLLAPIEARIIDASTAHRTDPDWVYGFPEIHPKQRELIRNSSRVSVPGCHASGFISIVRPLIEHKLISSDTILACTSITGYSGGGKAMISEYENNKNPDGTSKDSSLDSPRIYGLSQHHKHIPEMKKFGGINKAPAFVPIVAGYYSGMLVTIPFNGELFSGKTGLSDLEKVYKDFYAGEEMIRIISLDSKEKNGFISSNKLSDRDDMEILIYGSEEKIIISSRYDNLGKGASGAAVQCMNIMLGIEETEGLVKGKKYEEE